MYSSWQIDPASSSNPWDNGGGGNNNSSSIHMIPQPAYPSYDEQHQHPHQQQQQQPLESHHPHRASASVNHSSHFNPSLNASFTQIDPNQSYSNQSLSGLSKHHPTTAPSSFGQNIQPSEILSLSYHDNSVQLLDQASTFGHYSHPSMDLQDPADHDSEKPQLSASDRVTLSRSDTLDIDHPQLYYQSSSLSDHNLGETAASGHPDPEHASSLFHTNYFHGIPLSNHQPWQPSHNNNNNNNNNASIPSDLNQSSLTMNSVLQRPNKPSALKLDTINSCFPSDHDDAADSSNIHQLAYHLNQAQLTHNRIKAEESPPNVLTPQAPHSNFYPVPQLQPLFFNSYSSSSSDAQGAVQAAGRQPAVPVLLPAFGSEAEVVVEKSGESYTTPNVVYNDGSLSAASVTDSFASNGPDMNLPLEAANPSDRHIASRLGISGGPNSPIASQAASNFSPGSSTLSVAFSSKPSTRPSDGRTLKSIASYSSSSSSLGNASNLDAAGARPRSSSSSLVVGGRKSTNLASPSSMGMRGEAQPGVNGGRAIGMGGLTQSRSVQNLAQANATSANNMPSPPTPSNLNSVWATSTQQHTQSFQGFQTSHVQQFSSPTLTSPAQSQYSPHTFYGSQSQHSQLGMSYYSLSIENSQRFGSNNSLASDNLDVAGFNEHRLSPALANSAQISSNPPHTNHDGHSTPTIMEEEEEQQQQQQQQQQGMVRDLGLHLRSDPSCHTQLQTAQEQHQHQQQQALMHRSMSGPLHSAHGESLPFRSPYPFQPNMRPSLYQHVSMAEMSQARQLHGLGMSEQSIGDCSSYIRNILRQYIACPSRLGLGERNVLIMTTKVAQKSYGAEKRFLCPPPMVLLIGSSWWNVCPDASRPPPFQIQGQTESDQVPTVLSPPRITINISGEPSIQDGALEWASSSGRLIDVGNPSSEMAISGRCIGKQLYISDIDEKRRHVEALVSISVPGASLLDRRLLGTFASKPIKVISKPSKKRQSSRNTELCVSHGSVISLFHRLRSQTVSTRYLCVSGAPSWFKGSDNQPFLNLNPFDQKGQESPSCFVAKMSSWDPFVIYLVDPTKRADANSAPPTQPPVKGYPPPPPNALPTSGLSNSQMTVHYNQPIVLQCLNTAVVSPVMVVRKVEKGTTVLGGASAGGSSFSREAYGDPVSQLHKIALEVLEEPSVAAAAPRSQADSAEAMPLGQSGPFLACLNESVGMHRPSEPRKLIPNTFSVPSTPTTPITPMNVAAIADADMSKMGILPTSPTSVAAAYAAAQTRFSLASARGSMLPSSGLSGSGGGDTSAMEPPASTDAGKIKRPRRVSSSVVVQKERAAVAAAASKNRRRGQSLSVVGMQNQGLGGEGDLMRRSSSFAASDSLAPGSITPGAIWSVEVADSDIWTVVGTDIARHSFYVPPRLVGGSQPKACVTDSSIAHLITVPAPAQPITPIPQLHNVVAPTRDSRSPINGASTEQGSGMVTLFGEHFHPNLFVFFGDWKSEHVEVRSRQTIVCSAPPSFENGVPRGRVPIMLVRHDGIIFPTELHYQC